jgi:hypothetical protein
MEEARAGIGHAVRHAPGRVHTDSASVRTIPQAEEEGQVIASPRIRTHTRSLTLIPRSLVTIRVNAMHSSHPQIDGAV